MVVDKRPDVTVLGSEVLARHGLEATLDEMGALAGCSCVTCQNQRRQYAIHEVVGDNYQPTPTEEPQSIPAPPPTPLRDIPGKTKPVSRKTPRLPKHEQGLLKVINRQKVSLEKAKKNYFKAKKAGTAWRLLSEEYGVDIMPELTELIPEWLLNLEFDRLTDDAYDRWVRELLVAKGICTSRLGRTLRDGVYQYDLRISNNNTSRMSAEARLRLVRRYLDELKQRDPAMSYAITTLPYDSNVAHILIRATAVNINDLDGRLFSAASYPWLHKLIIEDGWLPTVWCRVSFYLGNISHSNRGIYRLDSRLTTTELEFTIKALRNHHIMQHLCFGTSTEATRDNRRRVQGRVANLYTALVSPNLHEFMFDFRGKETITCYHSETGEIRDINLKEYVCPPCIEEEGSEACGSCSVFGSYTTRSAF